MGIIHPFMSWVIIHYHYLVSVVSKIKFYGHKGIRAEHSTTKRQKWPNRKYLLIYLLICAVSSRRRSLWWSSKCRQFLFCLPNRKCQKLHAWNWLICAVCIGMGFLGMRNTMVNPKVWSIPVLRARQEVPASIFPTDFATWNFQELFSFEQRVDNWQC